MRGEKTKNLKALILTAPLLLLAEMLWLSATALMAGPDPTVMEKPVMNQISPTAASAPALPPLDLSPPVRLETFTFGLG